MADALSASHILQLPAAPPPRLLLHRSLRRFPLPARSQLPKSFPAPASSSIPPPRRSWTAAAAATSWNSVEEGAKAPVDNDAPSSIQLLPLASEEEFNRVIADEPVVVLWMAKWCRKCIYLKPKLEKLAADYHPRIRFYCVDVNAVPQRLVSRAGITMGSDCCTTST